MSLYTTAKSEKGLTKTGDISVAWARAKLNKSGTREKTKLEIRRFLANPKHADFCPQKLGSRGGTASAGYNLPRKGAAEKRCATKLARKRWGAKRTRKKNPARGNLTKRELRQAIALYRKFREEEPQFVDTVTVTLPKAAMVIGYCDGVLYNTTRGGKREYYKHEFTGKSCPLLCASGDGSQLFFVGGSYDFTEDGIVDR